MTETTAEKAEVTPAELEAQRHKKEMIGRYVAMFLMPILMIGIMITGYLFAMHNPTSRDMPIAVTGSSSQEFISGLEQIDADENGKKRAVDLIKVDSATEARELVMNREVSGALVIEGTDATLYTATAAGASQVAVVQQLVAPQIAAQNLHLENTDLRPLPESDPAGLGAMFLATALVMAGYLPLSITLSNAPQLMRFRRFVPLLAGWSVFSALLAWVVTGPTLGIVDGSDAWAVMGVAALGVFAIGAVQLFLTRVLGPMAVLAAMLLLMALGVPASNMSISIYTAPKFYLFLHDILPTSAIGEALRSVLYFDGRGAWPYLLVLIIGAAAGLVLTLILDSVKRAKGKMPEHVMVNLPSLHGGPRPKSKFWQYFQLAVFPIAMVGLMLTAMLGAMHSPTPKDMPVVVVASSEEQGQQMADALDEQMDGMFDFTVMTSADRARSQVEHRDVVGAFVLPSAELPEATVIVNQSAGSAGAQLVERVFTGVAQAQQLPVATDDVAPLPERDSMGTVTMYVAMGWMMAGFMIIVVGANAAPTSRPLNKLLPIVAMYSVAMSAFVYLIAGPITGAVEGHFWQLFGAGAVAIMAVAMFATVFERLMGLLAIIPIVGVLMFLGVPASGGAMSIFMEPEFFRGLHEWLPMSAAVEGVRSILYFGSDVLGVNLLKLIGWGAGSLILVSIIDKFKPVRTKGEQIMVDM